MTTSYNGGGVMRKARPADGTGEDGEWSDNGAGDGDWWYNDEGEWRHPYDNETRYDAGEDCMLVWTGSSWVKASEYDPGVPIGDTPWLWMIVLLGAYACTRYIHKKKTA